MGGGPEDMGGVLRALGGTWGVLRQLGGVLRALGGHGGVLSLWGGSCGGPEGTGGSWGDLGGRPAQGTGRERTPSPSMHLGVVQRMRKAVRLLIGQEGFLTVRGS